MQKRIYGYVHYPHRGIPLHLHKNNLTYHSTGKNITGKFFNQKRIQKREVWNEREIKKTISNKKENM